MRPFCTSLALTLSLLAHPAAAEILVGVAVPLSGRFAEQGRAIQDAVSRAIEAVNADGGVLGEPLRLIAEDDGCGAKAGAEAARKLIEQMVAVVVGHTCASAALAAAPVYAKAVKPVFALSRHPDLTDKRAGPTIFRMAGRDDRQAPALVEHVLKAMQARRIALVHDRTLYGKALIEAVSKALTPAQLAPVLIDTIVAGDKDYAGLASRLKQADADVIIFGGYATEAAVVLQSIRAAGLKTRLIGGDALAGEAMLAEKAVILEGVRFLRPPQADELWPLGHPLNLSLGLATGDAAPMLAAIALRTWTAAARGAGAADGASIGERIQSGPLASGPQEIVHRSADGTTTQVSRRPAGFAANGDAELASYRVYRVRNGKIMLEP